jgi:pyruvate dehydrogenase E2 component (dihydrolipoamide acetyltransferase)
VSSASSVVEISSVVGSILLPTDFTLPELGENIQAGDVLRVLVKQGDTLAKEQPVLELETDKATIEVPSSVAGQVKDIKVKAGDKVKVGQAILTVDDGEASNKAESSEAPPAREAEPREPGPRESESRESESRESEARGSEPRRQSQAPREPQESRESQAPREPQESRESQAPRESQARRDSQSPRESPPPRETQGTKAAVAKSENAAEAGSEEPREPAKRETAGDKSGAKVVDISRGARPPAEQPPAAPEMPTAPAAPSVRRMARELGVDINQVAGSGDAGRISVEDVKNHAKRLVTGAARSGGVASEALPDFSRWGAVERQPMRAVRRKTAEHLAAAWAAIPHVTQFDVADITALEELRTKYAKQTEAAGGSLTVTAIAVKVVASALRVFPQFNTSIDLANDEIVVKKYVNIGIAVDTDRGLLVPVIRNADQKNIIQIAAELSQLSEKARSRKIALEEMQGGTFSISNLGGIGGTYFTPIVNAPEVAILGISRASMQPKFTNNQFVPRMMLPLSLSYDHRAIDGADGIRFLRWVVQALEEPFVLALQG